MSARPVVITGASSGIGRCTALDLDARGFRVFAGVRRDEDAEALLAVASERLSPLRLEVTDAASIAAAAREVAQVLDGAPLHGLVNNAGIAWTAPLEFVQVDDLRRQFEVNVFGVAAVTAAFLPQLERPGGRIVNVSSGAGRIATPLLGPYSASKYALEAMSDALRIEVRSQGIRVSVIEPGFIATPMHERNEVRTEQMLGALSKQAHARYDASIQRLRASNERLSRRGAPPERVARVIHHALSSSRPRTRYPVTAEARLLAWLGPFLTDRMRDAILGRIVGL